MYKIQNLILSLKFVHAHKHPVIVKISVHSLAKNLIVTKTGKFRVPTSLSVLKE